MSEQEHVKPDGPEWRLVKMTEAEACAILLGPELLPMSLVIVAIYGGWPSNAMYGGR